MKVDWRLQSGVCMVMIHLNSVQNGETMKTDRIMAAGLGLAVWMAIAMSLPGTARGQFGGVRMEDKKPNAPMAAKMEEKKDPAAEQADAKWKEWEETVKKAEAGDAWSQYRLGEM